MQICGCDGLPNLSQVGMHIRSVLTHPCMAFVVVVVSCLCSRTFYPLNNFPMYSDPGPEPSEFVVVSDALDAPVDIQSLTGETSAKVKKKYISERNKLATAAGIEKADEATPEICAEAWQKVAQSLVPLAERRKKSLPDSLKLKIGEIYQEDGAFREEYRQIGIAALTKKEAAPQP